jgi:hypothetical protein
MSFLDCFEEEMITNVKITGLGTITSYDLSGRPVYGTGTIKYNSGAAVWQGTSAQIFTLDRISNPGAYQVVLEPARVTGTLADTDVATFTINGVELDYDINIPDDILGLGEVIQITATKRVVDE